MVMMSDQDFFSVFYVHGRFQEYVIFHYFINLQEFVLRISVLSLRPVSNTYTKPYILVSVLKLEVIPYLALHLHKLLQTNTLHWLPASTLLPPLLTEAKEAEGAQHSSPGQSATVYCF